MPESALHAVDYHFYAAMIGDSTSPPSAMLLLRAGNAGHKSCRQKLDEAYSCARTARRFLLQYRWAINLTD